MLTTCHAGFTYINLYNLPKAYEVDATAILPFYKRGKKLRQVLGGGGRPGKPAQRHPEAESESESQGIWLQH